MDISQLAGLPTTATSALLYFRHTYLPAVAPPDPLRTMPNLGRWGTPDTLYTANSVPVVWAEYCRWVPQEIEDADPTGGIGLTPDNLEALAPLELGDPVPRRALYSIRFGFRALADLTSVDAQNVLAAVGFDLGNFYSDDFTQTSALARAGVALGWEALLAPSAAWRLGDGYAIAVFDAGRSRIDRVNELARAARPTVGTAYATSYRIDQRPAWLGPPPTT